MKQNVAVVLASGSPRRRELLQQAGISFTVLVSEADETSEERQPDRRVMELAGKKGQAVSDSFIQNTDPEKLRTLLPAGGGVLIVAADTLVFSRAEHRDGDAVYASESAAGTATGTAMGSAAGTATGTAMGSATGTASESAAETATGIAVKYDQKNDESGDPAYCGVLGKPADVRDAQRMLMQLSGRTHEVYTGVDLEYLQVVEEGGRPTLRLTDRTRFAERTEVEMYPFDEAEALDYIATGEPMDKAGAYGIQGIGARLVKEIRGDYNNVVGFPLARFIRVAAEKGYISFGTSS